jgi:hypothetical protein
MNKLFAKLLCGAVLTCAIQAQSQSVSLTFQDGTDDGFGLKFDNDASANFSIVDIGGSLRMQVPRTGAFQETDIGSGSNPFLAALNAAVLDPSGYTLSYDWYVDTSTFGTGAGNFLQLGSYLNDGDGTYTQDFPNTGTHEVDLNGTQLASGQVFSGTFSQTFAQVFGDTSAFATTPAQTFQRLGFIVNGDGANQSVFFDNVTVAPIPEPSSLALGAVGALSGLMMLIRRCKA